MTTIQINKKIEELDQLIMVCGGKGDIQYMVAEKNKYLKLLGEEEHKKWMKGGVE